MDQERLRFESIVGWALVGTYLGCMVRFISSRILYCHQPSYCHTIRPTMAITFQLNAQSDYARAGLMNTSHGDVPTPAFMPVATQGSVKSLSPHELRDLGARIVLGNTYHLYLRPGVELLREMGGLSSFMSWNGPTLTDSGGFQAFSLGPRARISDAGIMFRSLIDGSSHFFTPEKAITYQEMIGGDIIMALDQCLTYTQDEKAANEAMERTHNWAVQSKAAHKTNEQSLFGIVQGGVFPKLREKSATFITSLDFPGYAIGGLAVGESKATMYPLVAQTSAILPKEKPRYLMGVGSPEDLVECVGRGIDLFDCVLPTRVARNGALFTRSGRRDITNAKLFRGVEIPIDEGCDCFACQNFSAGYLHHLFRSRELLGLRLASIHNLRFIMHLMEDMRRAIVSDTFQEYAQNFLRHYQPANETARLEQRKKRIAAWQ